MLLLFNCPTTWQILLIRPASLQGISGEPAHIIYFHTSNKHPSVQANKNFNDTFQMVFLNMLCLQKTRSEPFRLIRRMEKAQVPKAASHSDGRLQVSKTQLASGETGIGRCILFVFRLFID